VFLSDSFGCKETEEVERSRRTIFGGESLEVFCTNASIFKFPNLPKRLVYLGQGTSPVGFSEVGWSPEGSPSRPLSSPEEPIDALHALVILLCLATLATHVGFLGNSMLYAYLYTYMLYAYLYTYARKIHMLYA
jgi:hypothetical protein